MIEVISLVLKGERRFEKICAYDQRVFLLLEYHRLECCPTATKGAVFGNFLMFCNDLVLIAVKAVFFEEYSGFIFIQIEVFGSLKQTV